ncbi:MAG TPA: hypothetical protein VE988_10935 [Gemmataceae bacterium]|nr:hypothetical protein [Gemmataceae bacterium]
MLALTSVILSLGFVGLMYWTYKAEKPPSPLALLFVAGFVAFLAVCFLPALSLQIVLVIPAFVFWKICQWPAKSLLAYMVLAMVGSYGILAFLVWEEINEHHRLRQEYAFESIEKRLPAPKASAQTKLSKETNEQLMQFENTVAEQSSNFRNVMLSRLHDKSVLDFIASPGFGVGRRIQPSKWSLKVDRFGDENPIPQPVLPPSTLYPEANLPEPTSVKPDPLRAMHMESVVNFANAGGYGLFFSPQKVAGFQSHRFNMVPQATEWKVQTIELVGLLMHDDPVVYVSNELPRMEKKGKVPTRALNIFEATGLKQLQEGDDLYVREGEGAIRMVGAVRSVEQCLKCHGGQRGDLLGAFSYRLQRVQ